MALPVAKVRRPVALRPAESSTRLQPLKAAPSQLPLAPASRSGAERLHAGLSSGRQGSPLPLQLSRARTAPAARPATSQAVSDMVALVAARQAEEQSEAEEQGVLDRQQDIESKFQTSNLKAIICLRYLQI